MLNIREIHDSIHQLERIITRLKSELDKTRNLLYSIHIKQHQDSKDNDNYIATPDNVEFILTDNNTSPSTLMVRESTLSEYSKITISLSELGLNKKSMVSKRAKPVIIRKSSSSYHHIISYLKDYPYERFYIIMLNNRLELIKIEMVSEGGFTSTMVDIRRIFKTALEYNAVNIILAHNHPSGQTHPSEADIQLTKRIYEAGNILDITVLDHIMVGKRGYYSLADHGLM